MTTTVKQLIEGIGQETKLANWDLANVLCAIHLYGTHQIEPSATWVDVAAYYLNLPGTCDTCPVAKGCPALRYWE